MVLNQKILPRLVMWLLVMCLLAVPLCAGLLLASVA